MCVPSFSTYVMVIVCMYVCTKSLGGLSFTPYLVSILVLVWGGLVSDLAFGSAHRKPEQEQEH
jgi:hypothetical protein